MGDIVFVRAELQGGAQIQSHAVLAGEEGVGDMQRVLPVDEEKPLLDDHPRRLESPDR